MNKIDYKVILNGDLWAIWLRLLISALLNRYFKCYKITILKFWSIKFILIIKIQVEELFNLMQFF